MIYKDYKILIFSFKFILLRDMAGRIKPFNSQGDRFWKSHFKCLYFIKFFISVFIDFLEDSMKISELSILIAGLYMVGLNAEFLGVYQAYALCIPDFPNYISNIPSILSLETSFPKYSHYFYPLIFIGNLKSCPYFLTLFCFCFSVYDLILLSIDVIVNIDCVLCRSW